LDEKKKLRELSQKHRNLSTSMSRKKEEPLYIKLENKFNSEYVLPQLEERKKELSRIRDIRRPMSKEDLEMHAVRHEEVLK
jgi:hypothetical protein